MKKEPPVVNSAGVLDAVQRHLGEDLAGVERAIEAALRVEGDLMRQVAVYIGESKGKRLRPAIALLAARARDWRADSGAPGGACPPPLPSLEELALGEALAPPAAPASPRGRERVAAALELIHTATLLHDDVIDRASTRRGRPTVNARWGDDVAILMADYLYATAFELTLSCLNPAALLIITRVSREMTVGEMLQIELREGWLSVESYLEIIQRKTARLFGACAATGAITGGAPPGSVKKISEFGLHFGMAFQLTDDALDYSAQGAKWGKRVGADLSEGKQTLPLLHTLAEADAADREALVACLRNGREFETVNRYVRKYQGVEATRALARDYARRALAALEEALLPAGNGAALSPGARESSALLRELTQYIVDREY